MEIIIFVALLVIAVPVGSIAGIYFLMKIAVKNAIRELREEDKKNQQK